MVKQIELLIPPDKINLPGILQQEAAKLLNIPSEKISAVIAKKKSIDARRRIFIRLQVDVYIDESPKTENNTIIYRPVSSDKKVLIVGFGPAGMFAALKLIELGIKPIVVERGKDVQERRRDLRAIQQSDIVNPDSNYCFGEGGAGTYSDGKLYTRSTKRGNVKRILDIFIQHGADPEIRIESHPHIGSNKLPKIVQSIRETIIENGGEVHFNSKVTDFILKNNKILGVVINDETELFADSVMLATGHSARDIYYLLHKKNIFIEPKSFALGVRIEHPQELINEIQYHTREKDENLPPATYNLSCQIKDRGVYSFCMCPGGIIVPATTSPGEIVVNGMSVSRRNSPFANSGFVVEVTPKEWSKFEDRQPFSGLMLQKEFEQSSFELANNSLKAPAQRVTDFVNCKSSKSLPDTSYIPGLTSIDLHNYLPEFISTRLRKGVLEFDKKMRGYNTNEAIIVAAETRTSSPIRIPRSNETYMHKDIAALFPIGEGAGYAGGIVSSAIDGENAAEFVAKFVA